MSFAQYINTIFCDEGPLGYVRAYEDSEAPEQLLTYTELLFRNPPAPIEELPPDKLNDGLRKLVEADCILGLLAYEPVDERLRMSVIHSLPCLFANVFDKHGDLFIKAVWWECLIGSYWRDGPSIRESPRAGRAILCSLSTILSSTNNEHSQMSALRGLCEFQAFALSGEIDSIVRRFEHSPMPLSKAVGSLADVVRRGEYP